MGREVRMVPPDWEHPKDQNNRYIPLFGGSFSQQAREWDEKNAMWNKGQRWGWTENDWIDIEEKYSGLTFEEWNGPRPKEVDYMPDWNPEECILYMMYEDCSEGTPISPAFETPEELAHWLEDNNASAFASETATYEQWLRVCKGDYAPSAVYTPKTGLISGVAAEL